SEPTPPLAAGPPPPGLGCPCSPPDSPRRRHAQEVDLRSPPTADRREERGTARGGSAHLGESGGG
ncbi:unnamed protein product, partial [Gulo gulo]